ncbi:hypothetical protein [Oceanobacillus sp. FSL H7-0719]
MTEKLNRMDREQIIFQLMVYTLYTEDALKKLSDTELIEMYRVKVEGV